MARQFTLLKIPVLGDAPCEFINCEDEDHNLYQYLRSKTDWSGLDAQGWGGSEVRYDNYIFEDSNGKHSSYKVFYAGDGLDRKLQPNHRAIALALNGMYKKLKKYIKPLEDSRQYELAEEWGTNLFVGDIVLQLKPNQALPKFGGFTDNPIIHNLYLTSGLRFDPTPQFKRKYPEDWRQRADAGMKRGSLPSGIISFADIEARGWERYEYKIYCGSSLTQEYIDQVVEWFPEEIREDEKKQMEDAMANQ